jgi:hypothetical protein
LDFRHFRPLAPHTRPPRALYVRSTTDPTPKASRLPRSSSIEFLGQDPKK